MIELSSLYIPINEPKHSHVAKLVFSKYQETLKYVRQTGNSGITTENALIERSAERLIFHLEQLLLQVPATLKNH